MRYSKISVITPSFNQGRYIEQTILSVIGQQYPNLEYIIIDGGSTDETIDIIQKYEQHITYWVSEKDKGQSYAINKGFEKATGDILCWLNSDDYYLPGCLLHVNATLNNHNAELLYGNTIHLNEGENKAFGSQFDPFKNWDIKQGDFITQPSSFWTRKAWELTDRLNEDLHFGFDWEWFARAKECGVTLIPSANYYSIYRLHKEQKSDGNNIDRFIELISIERKLNPEKFEFLDNYITKHFKRLSLLFKLTGYSIISPLQYRVFKLFHPELMKRIDRISLQKYINIIKVEKIEH